MTDDTDQGGKAPDIASTQQAPIVETTPQRQVFNPVTGVVGPHDFDGTRPEDIPKLIKPREYVDLPMGPGQVTGGVGLNMSTKYAKPIATGGDRTPDQGDNPPEDVAK